MTDSKTRNLHRRAIRFWLLAVSFLVFVMVVVGGATRLTESGLSIVEWKLVTGTLPPLNEAQWLAEFESYKTIPQYQLVNKGMSLAEFKTIYWWEWIHRLLGRLIGGAFLVPFLWFLWRGWIEPALKGRLWLIFGLGALQGFVGWWMVASGLSGRTEVSQYRLAVHLTLACVIIAAMVWLAQRIAGRPALSVSSRVRTTALALVGLVLIQIYLGAIVAGLRAGLSFNTWPLIDGQFVPGFEQLLAIEPAWRNAFENVLTVQFNHRMFGYLLWIVTALHVIDIARSAGRGPALTNALLLFGGITIQAVLGILALVYRVPIGLALAHQGVAVIVLVIAVEHAERVHRFARASAFPPRAMAQAAE